MIREIAWYFEDARFTNMAETLEKSVSAYAEALASGAAENDIRARREEARSLFEAECAASGLKAEGYAAGGSFINIDAEFFTSGNLDREALNACIKNIIKGHCYEKTLWLYMGTTGTFTALSKAAMRREGRAWEDLFPRAYRKKYPRKNPLEKKCGGDVVLYAWNDGTFSRNYLPEKARWRFDALRDKSGFDWKEGYDPNAEVAKKGWRGGFDDEGVWRRCDSSGEGGSERPVESPPLFLINRGCFAMLYDPQGFLFSQEEIFYFTEDGGLYGKLSPDMEKTARKIRAALTGMGLTSIGEAAGPSGCEEEAVNRACRALFKEIVSPGLVVRSAEEANAAINEKIREAQNREASSAGVRLERTIRFLRQAGASSGGLEEALLTGVFRLPLEPRTREGCILLGLNAEEARCAMSHPVPPGRESEFYSALSNIFAAWDVYKNCGLAKQEMISRVYEALCEKTVDGEKSAAEKTLAAETSLEGLFGMDNSFAAPLGFLHSSGIPGIFGEREIVNFYVREAAASYIRKLEKKKTLPRGAGDEVFSVLSEQPAFTKEKEDVLNRALTRALSQYPAVHLSTGMSVASLTRAACSAVEGKEGAFLEKRVFWELPLHSFVRNAGRKNFQMRQVSITAAGGDGEKNEMRPLIVVGAARGESLAEKGFGYKVLREKYGMTEDAAHKTEKFLRTVRMDEEISREEASLFMADADRCLAEFGKSGAGAFRAAFLKLIDSREDAAYNLTAEDGFGAYLKSGRFKASRLKAESIAEF
ncbi:MAG: hypothetical protein LBC67_06150, partial [Spirochaetales bacterium]|nr:hypothetical protein [Spirochaetales bacterium]